MAEELDAVDELAALAPFDKLAVKGDFRHVLEFPLGNQADAGARLEESVVERGVLLLVERCHGIVLVMDLRIVPIDVDDKALIRVLVFKQVEADCEFRDQVHAVPLEGIGRREGGGVEYIDLAGLIIGYKFHRSLSFLR